MIRALLLLVPCVAFAHVEQDKRMHAGVSFVAGVASANVWPTEPVKAFGAAMVPGIAKELLDARKGGSGFDTKDLMADAIGAALGVAGTSWLIARTNKTTVIAYRTEF